MMELKFTSHFKKTYNKLVIRNPECGFDILSALLLFSSDPFNPKLGTYKLSGDKKKLWSFSIHFDLRIIFAFETGTSVIFINVGTHDEVY